jgi:hypothetical protein|tara:strand:+ start:528 stop:923 length:396 start_codon:yes stop_codon:yes gene_type:complete
MKDDHKNMLLGFLAAKSQNQSINNGLVHFERLNWFQKIWLSIVVWGIPLFSIIIFTVASIDTNRAINFLGMSFEGSRQIWMAIILGVGSIYVLFKAIRRFPRFLFWLTFGPPFIISLIWLFGPNIGLTYFQ